ncbi:MAG: BsuPI-related putative proteinase inhibitor [Candidatus Solibacter sp.]
MISTRLLTAIAVLAGVASGADFFPLATGNTWTYKDAKFGQTLTVRVGLPFLINDKVYYSLRGYTDTQLLVRKDERGQLVYLDEDRQQDLLLTFFEPFENWWESPGRTCAQWGLTSGKRGQHEGPAGSFPDVLEVRYRTFTCADAGTQLEQFAENIGMVRRVEQSFTGPRTLDLVSARVGKLRLDTAPTGQFRVTAEPVGDQLAITLALETPEALKLQFGSGQEYDVAVRDEQGNVVWRWSNDKAFTQALHERVVSGLWLIAVNAPLPQSKSYTVQGWLTTLGDAPYFAAAIALPAAR